METKPLFDELFPENNGEGQEMPYFSRIHSFCNQNPTETFFDERNNGQFENNPALWEKQNSDQDSEHNDDGSVQSHKICTSGLYNFDEEEKELEVILNCKLFS